MDELSQTHTSQEEQAPRPTQSRKRKIDSDCGDELLAKRTPLTRKNLSLFNKMGKNKKASEPTDEVGSSKTTSTTTSGFGLKAYKNGILLPLSSKTPMNHKTRCERNARARGTTSPTESEHRRYVDKIKKASNEITMTIETIELLKEYDNEGYIRVFNRAFTGFPKDVGFNNGLPAPQPDFIEGLLMEEFDAFPIDEYISGAILYRDDCRSVALPHIAGEWKGPDGSMRDAELQSSYAGAALVYARNQALLYIGKFDLPGHAKVTTFTINGTNLNFFSHYAAWTENKVLKYHQYPEGSYNMTNYQQFIAGWRHLRNAQDDARDLSYALRDQLRERWEQQRHSGLHSVGEGVSPLSVPDTESPNAKDEAGYEVREEPCQSTPAAPAEPHSSKSSPNSSNDSRKRNASSSQTSSPGRSWKKDDPKTVTRTTERQASGAKTGLKPGWEPGHRQSPCSTVQPPASTKQLRRSPRFATAPDNSGEGTVLPSSATTSRLRSRRKTASVMAPHSPSM